jgi:hypothetical protein
MPDTLVGYDRLVQMVADAQTPPILESAEGIIEWWRVNGVDADGLADFCAKLAADNMALMLRTASMTTDGDADAVLWSVLRVAFMSGMMLGVRLSNEVLDPGMVGE